MLFILSWQIFPLIFKLGIHHYPYRAHYCAHVLAALLWHDRTRDHHSKLTLTSRHPETINWCTKRLNPSKWAVPAVRWERLKPQCCITCSHFCPHRGCQLIVGLAYSQGDRRACPVESERERERAWVWRWRWSQTYRSSLCLLVG